MRRFAYAGIFILLFAASATSQTLQSQTTWGSAGAEFSGGVAVAPDGSAYLTGTSDSFAVDQFNQPEPRIFLVRFAPDGSLEWQRIWNGPSGHGKASVAVATDGSAYVTGLSKSNDGDVVLLKFSATGVLLWEREWGGSQQENVGAVATSPVDGSVMSLGERRASDRAPPGCSS